MGAAKVAHHILFRVATLLMSHHHHRCVIESSKAADKSEVVGEQPIAMQFHKVRKHQPDIIERVRTGGVPGNLNALPGGQSAVEVGLHRRQLLFQLANFRLKIDFLRTKLAQFGDLGFEIRDGLFKFQGAHKILAFH
jgi:hypothetical protein